MDGFLALVAQGVLILIAALTLNDLLCYRDRARLDIALMFGALGAIVLVQWITSVTQLRARWTDTLSALLFLVQPYLLLRLVQHFREVARWFLWLTLGGMIASWVALIALPAPLPTPPVLAIVVYFASVGGYTAFAFVQRGLETRGVTQWRLWLAAFGSCLISAVIFLAGVEVVLPMWADLTNSISRLLSVLAALSYYLGFAAPRWLRQIWQRSELYRFVREMTARLADEGQNETLERLRLAATRAVGGVGAVALLWEDDQKQFSVRTTNGLALATRTLAVNDGVIRRAWLEQRPILARRPSDFGLDAVDFPADVNADALFAVPIATKERRWGLLAVFLWRAPIFASDDLCLLAVFVEQTAIALAYTALLARARTLNEQLRQRTDQLESANKELQSEIAERKHIEKRLIYQSQLLANVHDAIIATDEQFTLTEWNRAAEQMYGWTAEEAIGRKVNEVISTEFSDAQLTEALRLLRETGHYRVEVVQYRRDGKLIHVEGTTMALCDAEGRITGYVSVNRDITKRKQAEEALRASEERLRTAISNIPIILYALDHKGVFTLSEGKGLGALGLEPGEVVGKSVFELYGDEPDVVQVLHRALAGESFSAVVDARGLAFEAWYSPLCNDRGEFVGVIGVAIDITERRQAEKALRESEERYRNLVELSPDMISVHSEGKILYTNPAAAKLVGVSRPQELIGRSMFECVHPDARQSLAARLEEIYRAGEQRRLVETQFSRLDGKVIDIEVSSTPVNHQGKVARQVIVRDITERKRAEEERSLLYEEVRASRERLQILSRQLIEAQELERRRIARELHDEIGQVLTAVRTNLQTIQLSPDLSTLGPRLGESIGIVERALRQVRDLSLDLRPSLLDDFGLVPALEWYVDRQAERAGFTAEFVAESPETRLSSVLETACFRVAQAALTNVARHAQAKHVRVELRRTETELHLTICDDGIGFEVDAVLERAAHGTSLGLLGMRERAQLAGGQIEIESAPRRGTEIRARFPLSISR